jgi:hypothetical protein
MNLKSGWEIGEGGMCGVALLCSAEFASLNIVQAMVNKKEIQLTDSKSSSTSWLVNTGHSTEKCTS